MLNVDDMYPGDLYTDKAGNVYRVKGYWTEPVVQMELVLNASGDPLGGHVEMGGVSGLMWDGFHLLKKRSRVIDQ